MPTRDSLSAMSLSYDDSITQKLIWLDVCHGAGCSDWTWTLSRDCFLFWTQTVSYFSTGKEGSPSWFWGLSSLFVFTPSWVIMSSVFCFTFSLRPLLQHRSDDSGETRHLPPRWRVALSWEDFLPLSLQLRKYSGYFLHMKWSSGLEFYSAVVLFVEGAEHRERLAVAPLKLVYRDQRCPLSRLLEGWKSLKASWF